MAFERGAAKHGGGDGWADVWKKAFFGWEYKGRHKDLDAALCRVLQKLKDLEKEVIVFARTGCRPVSPVS